MAGRRRLSAGMVRSFDRHDGHEGRVYRREWHAHAPDCDLTHAPTRLQLAEVCAAAVDKDASTRALTAARQLRRRKAGRRPSEQAIARLAKRRGLDAVAYAAALDRLRALVAAQRRTPTSAAELLALRRRA
jgi:hypothetical protein